MSERKLREIQQDVAHEVERDLSQIDGGDLNLLAYVGLSEEVGEVMGIVKRMIRQGPNDAERCTREHLVEELGDVMWYLAFVCNQEGITFDELWDYNRAKLEARYGE